MSQEIRYELSTLGACCGTDTLYFDSLNEILLNGYDNGIVTLQVKEDCGHWEDKARSELQELN
jgi:hypothetical protein